MMFESNARSHYKRNYQLTYKKYEGQKGKVV